MTKAVVFKEGSFFKVLPELPKEGQRWAVASQGPAAARAHHTSLELLCERFHILSFSISTEESTVALKDSREGLEVLSGEALKNTLRMAVF